MDNEQLIDTLTVELRSGFRSVTERIDQTNARLDQTNARLDQSNARLDQNIALTMDVRDRLDKLTDRVDNGFAGLGRYLVELERHHDQRISRLEKREKKD